MPIVSLAQAPIIRTGSWPATSPFSTTFPLTENPISESGAWTTTTVQSKTPSQTASGNAFGTMTTFDGVHFPDSCACLTVWNGANQRVTATLANASAVSGLETELLLRCKFDSSNATGYELDMVFSGGHAVLVRWDFTTASAPNAFLQLADSTTGPNPGAVSFADGAVWVFEVTGTVITAKCNGTVVISYDTASDGTKYSTGSPGIGFWNETGSSANSSKLAWADFLAVAL